MREMDYVNEDGYLARVMVIDAADLPEQGIPISLNAEAWGFSKEIQAVLWRGGFVTPKDFMKAGIFDVLARAYMREGIERDAAIRKANEIIMAIREELRNA